MGKQQFSGAMNPLMIHVAVYCSCRIAASHLHLVLLVPYIYMWYSECQIAAGIKHSYSQGLQALQVGQ